MHTREELYIGGQWVKSLGEGTIKVDNPADDELIGSVPVGSAADVDAAVAAGEVDLVEALTHPFPVRVIAEIIGIPAEDRERFKVWSDRVIADLGLGLFEQPSEAAAM